MRRWARLNAGPVWAPKLAGILLVSSTHACDAQPTSVRYDLTGTWFRSGGPAEGDACFPREQRNHEVTRNYWTVTRSSSGLTAVDDGGCHLTPRETSAGVLEADGEACALDEGKPLALLGINRRYVRFRIDPSNQTFAAGMVDRYLTNTGELVGCGLVEVVTQPVEREDSPERWRYEGEMQRQAESVAVDEPCGNWNSTLDSSGYVWLEGETATLEGLGCELPLGDGSDVTLHPCTDSDQLNAWSNSHDAALLPTLSFQAVQLDRETGAFFLAGEAVHADEKVCFQTTGMAERVE